MVKESLFPPRARALSPRPSTIAPEVSPSRHLSPHANLPSEPQMSLKTIETLSRVPPTNCPPPDQRTPPNRKYQTNPSLNKAFDINVRPPILPRGIPMAHLHWIPLPPLAKLPFEPEMSLKTMETPSHAPEPAVLRRYTRTSACYPLHSARQCASIADHMERPIRITAWIVLLAAGVAAASAQNSPPWNPDHSRNFLQSWCVGCHNQKLKSGGLSLESTDLGRIAAFFQPHQPRRGPEGPNLADGSRRLPRFQQ